MPPTMGPILDGLSGAGALDPVALGTEADDVEVGVGVGNDDEIDVGLGVELVRALEVVVALTDVGTA